MRRAAVLMMLLLVITIGGVCAAAAGVHAPHDQVILTETVVYGDREAAIVLAGAGFGAAILPELLSPPEKGVVCIPIEGAPKLSFGLFYKHYPGDSILKKFVQIARRNFSQMNQDGA